MRAREEEARCAFEHAEKAIPLNHDILTWMSAVVFVFDHPFFAVTCDDGSFEIPELPPGDYVFRAWHEPMTPDKPEILADRAVRLEPGARQTIEIELK